MTSNNGHPLVNTADLTYLKINFGFCLHNELCYSQLGGQNQCWRWTLARLGGQIPALLQPLLYLFIYSLRNAAVGDKQQN